MKLATGLIGGMIVGGAMLYAYKTCESKKINQRSVQFVTVDGDGDKKKGEGSGAGDNQANSEVG